MKHHNKDNAEQDKGTNRCNNNCIDDAEEETRGI